MTGGAKVTAGAGGSAVDEITLRPYHTEGKDAVGGLLFSNGELRTDRVQRRESKWDSSALNASPMRKIFWFPRLQIHRPRGGAVVLFRSRRKIRSCCAAKDLR
jgi:hypothetical protein